MAFALRSPLAWPQGVAPGFDQRHVAGKSVLFSALPSGSTFTNILNGKAGTTAGTPTAVMTAAGPGVSYPLTVAMTGISTGIVPIASATMAVILIPNSGVSAANMIRTASAGTIMALSLSTTTYLPTVFNGSTTSNFSGNPPALTIGVPYFIAASVNTAASGNSPTYIVVTNLLTGQMWSGTAQAAARPLTPTNGVPLIGQGGNQILAAMTSVSALDLPELQAWAQDPWLFWFPRRGNNALTLPQKVAHGAAGSSIAGAAVTATAGPVTASGNTAAHPSGAAVIATAGHVTVSSGSSITTIKPQTFAPSAFRGMFERPRSRPSLNQAHPATKGARLAAIATNTDGTMLDLVSNKAGFWSLAAGENGQLGPMAFPATTASGGITFTPPIAGEVFTSCTVAVIFQYRGSHFGQGLVAFDQPGGNGQLTCQSNGAIGWGISGAGAISGLPSGIVGHNYFLVGSRYNTTGFPRTRGVLVDMTTGQIYVGDGGAVAIATITAGASFTTLTYRIGGTCDQNRVAAAMISATSMTAAQQLEWAKDPWSFWYRNENLNRVGVAAISRSTGLITGAKVTAVAGSVIIPKTVALTGAAATTSAGALTKSITKALSGAAATTAAGALTVSAGIPGSVALVGAAVATAPGTLTVSSTKALTGAAATTSAGALAKAVTASVGGASVSTAAGSLASGPLLVVAGASVATAPGSVSLNSTKALSGAAATTSAGALAKSSVLGISGAFVAVSPGQSSQLVSASVSGAASTVAAGSVKGLTAASISGASIATASGSVTESSTKTLIGAGAAAIAGQVSVSTTTSVNGASVGTAAGALTKSTSWPAPGVSVSTAAGSTTESITAKVTGASITATANPLTSSIIQPVLVTISGASIAAFVGNVVVLAQTYVNGINDGRSLGLDWQSANAALAVGVSG